MRVKVPRQKSMLICHILHPLVLQCSGYIDFITIIIMETGTETEV